MKTIRIRFLLVLQCVLAINCADMIGGNGSETTNGFVQGRLMQSDGLPVSYTRVSLVPVNYNPVKEPAIKGTMTDTTDEAGFYTLETARPGVYNIQAQCLANRTSALVTGITVTANDTLRRPQDTLRFPGRLNVMVTGFNDTGYVYIAGTTLRAMVRNNAAVFDEVPAGHIPAVYYCNPADSARDHLIQTGTAVKPGDTATIADLTPWKFSKTLFLNTTSSGAAVTGNVTNFPLLVRLSAGSFDFSRAKSDGSDLRFTKSDNTPLSCEIELWDTANQRAAIWVRVDTVYGNNSAQYITMYCGNPAAANASNGARVFDTANGFQGVWHLNEAGNTTAFDATANGYSGTPRNMSAASGVTGLIGNAQQFDDTLTYIEMLNTTRGRLSFPMTGNFTLSAWAYMDKDSNESVLIGKGDYHYSLDCDLRFKWHISGHGQGMSMEAEDSTLPAIRHWQYIVGVRLGGQALLYVDGILADRKPLDYNQSYTWDTTSNMQIGKIANSMEHVWSGKIDEARISSVSRSADWVKLEFMNQKADDRLIVTK